jgi:hypothetical protein
VSSPEATATGFFRVVDTAHWDFIMLTGVALFGSDNGLALMAHIQRGLPELHGEFSLEMKRVWKSDMGSIAANYVKVKSF